MTINVQFEQRDMRMGVDFGEIQFVGGAGGGVVYVGTDEPPEDAKVWIDPEAAIEPGDIPSVSVEETESGATIMAVGWEGVTTAEIKNGKDGYTPIKGTDYFTSEDKAELVSAVISALPVYGGETA